MPRLWRINGAGLMAKLPDWPRTMPVYDIPVHERAYWDSLDARITCQSCARRQGVHCTVTQKLAQPLDLKHHCGDYRRIAPKNGGGF